MKCSSTLASRPSRGYNGLIVGVQKLRHAPFSLNAQGPSTMRNLFYPLLFAIARATDRELARYLEFLKAENQILRARWPKRIVCTPAERDGAPVVALPPGEAIGQVHCRSRLGGVIKHYYRAAA